MKNKYVRTIFSIHWGFYLSIALIATFSPVIISAYLNQMPNITLEKFNISWNIFSRYVCMAFFALMAFSYLYSFNKKRIFYNTDSLDSLKALSWQELESLTAQILRGLHYKVIDMGGAKADGGIDLIAYKKNFKYIIQCKQWKSTTVGVKVVREMLGVSMHEKASGVYIFTCGNFTKDAKEFAKGKPVYLVNGYQICKLIAKIKSGS